jgi:hypothetical protein
MVVDVGVAGGGDKHQSVGVVNPQLLHLLLMLPQGLLHLGRQWHHTLFPCLSGRPTVLT